MCRFSRHNFHTSSYLFRRTVSCLPFISYTVCTRSCLNHRFVLLRLFYLAKVSLVQRKSYFVSIYSQNLSMGTDGPVYSRLYIFSGDIEPISKRHQSNPFITNGDLIREDRKSF